MAHGRTLDMIALTKANRWKTPTERTMRPRDRSLNGKTRIKARKNKRRLS